jgi:hypothetical protein
MAQLMNGVYMPQKCQDSRELFIKKLNTPTPNGTFCG